MSDFAVLVGHEVCEVPDAQTWARWFESANRVVAQTTVGDAWVSTVFLGSDHSFGHGPKLWFETLVFGGEHADDMERYTDFTSPLPLHLPDERPNGRDGGDAHGVR